MIKKIIKAIKQLFCIHHYEINLDSSYGSADPISNYETYNCKWCKKVVIFIKPRK